MALNPARSVFQYNCQTWRRQNGLTANAVNAIVQGPGGYLWLGTSAGLVRFDGNEFKLFSVGHLPQARSSIVSSLANSQRGGLWFGMEHGAFGYCDGKDVSLWGRPDWGGENLDVDSVLETVKGEVWIAAEILAARLTPDNHFDMVLTNADGTVRYNVTALYEDSKGRVWLGTVDRGLFYWEDGILSKFPDPAFDKSTVRAVVEDQRGHIWVGTQWGLRCYSASFENQGLPFPWHPTRALLTDSHGTVWVGTSGGGLVRYLDGTPTEFRQTNGLADDFVSALAEDKEGSLWVGTRNGLSQLSDVKLPTYSKAEGLTAEINVAVCALHRGGLWVATDAGVAYLGEAVQHFGAEAGLKQLYVNGVFEAKNGDVYLVNGAMGIDVLSQGKVVATYTNSTWPTAFAEDERGVVVSVGGSLFRVGTNHFEPYVFAGDRNPPIYWVFGLAPSLDGSIWVAADQGIVRLKGEGFEMWSRDQGLPNSKIRWVIEDSEGVVWAGSELGIARLQDGQIRTISKADGLFDNIINAIVPDDHGNLWVDSSRGFFRVSRRNLNEVADGKAPRVYCEGFDGLDAVKSAEKYQQVPSGCKTSDGRIWFPVAQGIVMIDPTNLTMNPVPPRVHLQSVRAGGHELDADGGAIVPPGISDLEFHYAGLSYIAPLKIEYRYQLEGYDADWVMAGNRRSAFYTNLKPGRYQFCVQARSESGVWSSASAGFAVELQPWFYQTRWFYHSVGMGGIVLIVGFVALLTNRMERKQRQLRESRDLLETKVRERTTELATSNSALKKEIEERERMRIEIERVHAQLLEASRHAGQAEVASSVLHNVGNVLNSVNVSTGLLNDRVGKMRLANLSKAAELLQQPAAARPGFLTDDEKGRHLPHYLDELARHLTREQQEILGELQRLTQNVDHIKEIVAMQQSYAKAGGVLETMAPAELVDAALRMQADSFARHGVQIAREFEPTPLLTVDRHKVLQILVNLLRNARQACDEAVARDKRVLVRIHQSGEFAVRIEVSDNGVGIPSEDITRIFRHGFTTKKEGNGFGLHSAALAAKELGGTLTAHSEGTGRGARFVLELPTQPMRAERRKPDLGSKPNAEQRVSQAV